MCENDEKWIEGATQFRMSAGSFKSLNRTSMCIVNICNGFDLDRSTGPLACLILSSIRLVEKVRYPNLELGLYLAGVARKGNDKFKHSAFKTWTSNIVEWMFPLCVPFRVQYSLLLQHEILKKLVTYIDRVCLKPY